MPGDWRIWLAIGLGLLLALAAAVAVLLFIRRTRRRFERLPQRQPAPRYPVVLAHGIMGFDAIGVGRIRHEYFRGVRRGLEQSGCTVHVPRVARCGSIARRAAQLSELVRALPAAKVNVVAHSMGGLDARYAIARLGLADRVASLVTVGTPHRGTPLADLGADLGERMRLRRAMERLGLEAEGFWDLTVARMEAFNLEVADVPGVAYASVVAAAHRGRINPLLLPSWLWLRERAGDNDGLVPASSQRWGEVLAQIDADHWAQIGWSLRFDVAELYSGLVRELRGRGF